jgi:hypothetical protein
MRCFILFALIAAGSAYVVRDSTRFNIPFGGKGFPKNFEIPEGATKIDLKTPTDLPEGFTFVKDPSEFKFPNGLTPTDLKNGNVPAEWKKIDATTTKTVGPIDIDCTIVEPVVKSIPIEIDCTDVVTTIVDPVIKTFSSKSSSSSSVSKTINTVGDWDWEWKTFEPVITSDVYTINEFVVPEFFNTVRDFKSACDWFTIGEVPDFIQAVGEAIEWTTITADAPQIFHFGVNEYTRAQVEEMSAFIPDFILDEMELAGFFA